jgi:predicted anti-sigma-YlaC factor YlaD
MTDDTTPIACAKARRAIQEGLDGPVEAAARAAVDEHVAGCEACREYRDGMVALSDALRAAPELRFPDDALEQVWDRTVRAEPAPRSGLARHWRGLAAAAVVTFVLVGLWAWVGPVTPPTSGPSAEQLAELGMTHEEFDRALEEARLVLNLTGSAIKRTEQAAVGQVLGGEVGPALRRLPIPVTGSKEPRRTGT